MKYEDLKKKNAPETPGVYIFKDDSGRALYIGKAGSLKDRTKSYFLENIAETRGPLIAQMIEKASDIEYMETDSVLEAFIWEAKLIKQNQPPYNIKQKDDKTFNYVVITEEDWPKVVVVRESDLSYKFPAESIKYVFGPFPHGALFKEAFRMIRNIFPFRDEKCVPFAEQKEEAKPCFSRQVSLCPGVCAGEISKAEYLRSIQHLGLFFEGRKKALIEQITKEMNAYAGNKEFEKANRLKKTLNALNHIQDVSLLKKDLKEIPKGEKSFRIEAYDAAHISGSDAVGVMTVIENGEIKKADYRRFKIKVAGSGDDAGALREIISRRLKHKEWQYPDLVVVDGGKAQLNTAESALEEFKMDIPVMSVLKDERHKPKEILGSREMKNKYEREVLLSNMEAHRFAVSYHRKKRDKI